MVVGDNNRGEMFTLLSGSLKFTGRVVVFRSFTGLENRCMVEVSVTLNQNPEVETDLC